MSSAIKKLFSQTVVYGISSILGRLLNYLLVPLYTRVLAPAEYGIVTDLMAYMSFMLVVYSYGMETTFFRFSSQKVYNSHDVYGTIFLMITVTSILLTTLFIVFAQPIANLLSYNAYPQYIVYLSVILALDTLSAIQFAWLRKQEKAILFAIIRLLNIFLNIILNVYFVGYLKKGVEYIFITNIITSLCTTIILLPLTFPKKFVFQSRWIKSMLIYGAPLLVSGLAGMINENFDRVLLKRYLPQDFYPNLTNNDVVGIYGACYKLSIFVSLAVQAFRYGAEPFYFKKSADKDAKQTYSNIMDYFVPAVFFICIVVTAFLDEIGILIGKNFRSALHIVPVLLVANAFLGIYYNLSVWYKLTQKTQWSVYIALIGAGITILINLFGIPFYGMMASVYATLLCYAVMMILSYYFGQKFYPIPYRIKNLLFYIFFAIGLIIVLTHLPVHHLLVQYAIKLLAIALFVIVFLWQNRIIFKRFKI